MRGDGDFIAQGEQAPGVDHRDPVIIRRLGRGRQVGHVGGGGSVPLGNHPRRAPVKAGRQRTVEAIRGKVRRRGRRPGQADGIPVGSRGGQRHGRGGFSDDHVIHIPAVHHHGTVRGQAETKAEIRDPGIGGKIKLLARQGPLLARVRGQLRRNPTIAAIHGNLHPPEIVARFQRVPMLETERRPNGAGQRKRCRQGQGRVGIIGIERARAVGDGVAGRAIMRGGQPPGAARRPVGQTAFKIILEGKCPRRTGTG